MKGHDKAFFEAPLPGAQLFQPTVHVTIGMKSGNPRVHLLRRAFSAFFIGLCGSLLRTGLGMNRGSKTGRIPSVQSNGERGCSVQSNGGTRVVLSVQTHSGATLDLNPTRPQLNPFKGLSRFRKAFLVVKHRTSHVLYWFGVCQRHGVTGIISISANFFVPIIVRVPTL